MQERKRLQELMKTEIDDCVYFYKNIKKLPIYFTGVVKTLALNN